jgi:hypothetical protein
MKKRDAQTATTCERRIVVKDDDGLWGHKNESGETITKFIYGKVAEFKDGFARVTALDRRVGFVDWYGREITPLIYDFAGDFRNDYAWVSLNRMFGFINKIGEVRIPIMYQRVKDFVNKKAIVQLPDGRWGVINNWNHTIINFVYTSIKLTQAGYLAESEDPATKEKCLWFVDHNGNATIR